MQLNRRYLIIFLVMGASSCKPSALSSLRGDGPKAMAHAERYVLPDGTGVYLAVTPSEDMKATFKGKVMRILSPSGFMLPNDVELSYPTATTSATAAPTTTSKPVSAPMTPAVSDPSELLLNLAEVPLVSDWEILEVYNSKVDPEFFDCEIKPQAGQKQRWDMFCTKSLAAAYPLLLCTSLQDLLGRQPSAADVQSDQCVFTVPGMESAFNFQFDLKKEADVNALRKLRLRYIALLRQCSEKGGTDVFDDTNRQGWCRCPDTLGAMLYYYGDFLNKEDISQFAQTCKPKDAPVAGKPAQNQTKTTTNPSGSKSGIDSQLKESAVTAPSSR